MSGGRKSVVTPAAFNARQRRAPSGCASATWPPRRWGSRGLANRNSPGAKVSGGLTGTLAAGVPGGVRLKPNGPLLKALKADTGRFKISFKFSATDMATFETDTDKRTYKFK